MVKLSRTGDFSPWSTGTIAVPSSHFNVFLRKIAEAALLVRLAGGTAELAMSWKSAADAEAASSNARRTRLNDFFIMVFSSEMELGTEYDFPSRREDRRSELAILLVEHILQGGRD